MLPMVLSLNLAGIVFSGADVAGFFGNPSEELLVRWYQAGSFVPFFRAHAHLETQRREPWLFSPETKNLIRDAVLRRYRLMPYVYTAFHESSVDGAPIARALWTEFPTDSASNTIDNEYLFGPSILVHPVTEEGAKSVQVYLPAGVWYDFDTLQPSIGPSTVEIATPLSKVPAFYRGGRIIPTRQRQRRSTTQQAKDPFTLYVAPDSDGKAEGSLYIDDGKTFDYKKGSFDMVEFHLERDSSRNGAMTLTSETKTRGFETAVGIERIVIMGVSLKPSSVTFATQKQKDIPVTFKYDETTHVLTLKKPVPAVLDEWRITIA